MRNTRAIAAQIIYRVCYDAVSLSDAFLEPELQPRDDDRGFVKEICFGALRHWIQLQSILKELLERPLKKEDKDIECLLCVGLYQLLYMSVPEYALVNETVTVTRILKKSWASGLVNKILRMAIEKKKTNTFSHPGLTVQYEHPNWIIEKLKIDWPSDWESILNANNQKAPLFIRINQTKIQRADFEKLLRKDKIDYQSVLDLPHALILPNPLPVENIPGFFEGFFSVQDASGQKVVDYLDLQSSHSVLDACCAPGSKTTHILETCPDIKKIVSVDVSHHRLKKVTDNCKRLKLNTQHLELISADVCDIGTEYDEPTFDRILVDAPCSATGVIRRHPDIKILRKKTDIPTLVALQTRIVNAVWPTLKKGGKMIYTTCSIFSDENEKLIASFLESHSDARIHALENGWGNNLEYGQQVLPGNHDRDGFYYAVIVKN